MEIISLSLGGQKQCTISLQIWYEKSNLCFFFPKGALKDVPSNLKALKTNMIFYMAKQE